jgi:hypothetical protein
MTIKDIEHYKSWWYLQFLNKRNPLENMRGDRIKFGSKLLQKYKSI